MFLTGKTALVTGGGRGIGKAVAERLAADGARVIVAGRTVADLDAVASAIGGIAIPLDAANRPNVEAFLQTLRERDLTVDVLVNNAGIAESATYDRTTDDQWDRIFAVNVTAPFQLCRGLVPAMAKAGWGRVVQIASNAGLTGYAYTSAYCASKHALIGYTRSLAMEVARSGITVNAVCPGWVETDMAAAAAKRIAKKTGRDEDTARRTLESMSPQGRMVTAGEVADLVSMLCTEGARGIHGQTIAQDGGQVMN